MTPACSTCRTAMAALMLMACDVFFVGGPNNSPEGLQGQSQTTPQQNASIRAMRGQKAGDVVRVNEVAIYKRWPAEEVPWIITDEELSAWKKLITNEERELFIAAFWQRRNPQPEWVHNEYEEMYYRQIVYANEQFGAGVPGWRSDRGHVYIALGPPDSVDAHPDGGTYIRPAEKGGAKTELNPFELWRYRYLPGVGENIELEFLDPCRCGEYHLALDDSEMHALFHPLIIPQVWGQAPQSAPTVRFKDLEEVVNSKVRYNSVPFSIDVGYLKATTDTALVPVILHGTYRDLTFVNQDGVDRGNLRILGRFIDLAGRVAGTFEDSIRLNIPPELMDKFADSAWMYWKALPIRWGHYRLDIVVKDVNGDKVGTWGHGVLVPYSSNKLAASTVYFSDRSEPVAWRDIVGGDFVLGATKIRPRLPAGGKPATFKRDRDSKVNFWMQVYNLALDEKTRRASAEAEYRVIDTTKNEVVQDVTESTNETGNIGDQFILQKSLPLAMLASGRYQLKISISDLVSRQKISAAAEFVVE